MLFYTFFPETAFRLKLRQEIQFVMVEENFKDVVGARSGEVLVEKISVGRTFAYAVSVLAQMLWIVITTLLLRHRRRRPRKRKGLVGFRSQQTQLRLLGKYEPRHRKTAALPPSAPAHHPPPDFQ